MSFWDNMTTCERPFDDRTEWELASSPSGMVGFEWLSGEGPMGWIAYPCHEWSWRMWALKSNGKVTHSGQFYRDPDTGKQFWTYYGAPEGARVTDPGAVSYVSRAHAAGFAFVGVSPPAPSPEVPPTPPPDMDLDEDEYIPPTPSGFPWWLAALGVGALVTVIVIKARK